MAKKILTTPIKDEDLADIKAGDIIYLNGHIVTCRDVAHRRLIEGGRELPVNVRWLEQGKRHPLDRSQWMMSFSAPDGRTLQWVLRSQLGSGPLALLALRGLTLPDQIFTVDAAESAQVLTTGVGNSDMDEMEL